MNKLVRSAAAALLLSALLAACGNSEGGADDGADDPDGTPSEGQGGEEERDTFVSLDGVPGVTDDEISYAVIGTEANNPLGTCILDCYVDGIEAYFAWSLVRATLRWPKYVLSVPGWLDYVLRKVERRTGHRIQPTAAERRLPLLLLWGKFYRFWRARDRPPDD